MDRASQVGATVLVVGSGAAEVQKFQAPPLSIGCFLRVVSGSSVALVQAAGQSHTLGFPIGVSDQPMRINGPAQFFLSSGGATALVAQLILYSAGYSLQP